MPLLNRTISREKEIMKRSRLLPLLLLMGGTLLAQEIIPPVIADENRAFNRAVRLERLKQFEKAEEIYRALLKKNPKNTRVFLQLKALYRKQEDLTQLERLIQERLTVFPNDLQSHAELGELYFNQRDTARAVEYWQDMVNRTPRSQVTYRVMMQMYLRHQLYERLNELILQGRRIFNDPSLFSLDLGNVYRRNHHYEKATHEYLTFAIHHPRNMQAVSSHLLRMSDDTDSQPIIEAKLLERIPENEDVVRHLYCDFLFKTGRYGDALDQHRVLGIESDQDLDRWLHFATNLRKENQLSLALEAFSIILDRIPRPTDDHYLKLTGQALYGLALTYERQILPRETVPSLSGYFPENVFFERNVDGVHRIQVQPLQETFLLYDSILASLPTTTFSPQAHYRLGEIKYRITRDHDGALESYRSAQALTRDPKLIQDVTMRICDVLMAQGEFPAALEYLDERLDNSGSSDEKNKFLLKKCQVFFLSGEIDSTLFHLNRLISYLDINKDELNDALEIRAFIEENYHRVRETDRAAFHRYLKGEHLLKQAKLSEAQIVFREVADLYPDSPIADESGYRDGEIDLLLGNHDQAISTFSGLQHSPLGDRASVMVGEIYDRYLNNKEEAIRWYLSVLEEHPTSMLAEPVRYRIREIH